MSRTYLIAVPVLALLLGFGGVAVAESADTASASADAPGGEGFSVPGSGGPGWVGNVRLSGWSYNDGTR